MPMRPEPDIAVEEPPDIGALLGADTAEQHRPKDRTVTAAAQRSAEPEAPAEPVAAVPADAADEHRAPARSPTARPSYSMAGSADCPGDSGSLGCTPYAYSNRYRPPKPPPVAICSAGSDSVGG
jgi:hypothetical protein